MKIQTKSIQIAFVITLLVVCSTFLPKMYAVIPPPDGGYPGGNTAEGQNALLGLTSGGFNTAVGYFSLRSDTTGSFNTAMGAGALYVNNGIQNAATGVAALFSNTSGSYNTAHGALALFSNTMGSFNVATGDALYLNTTGNDNTANGAGALNSNTVGHDNTALGFQAGLDQTTGSNNVYIGAGMNGVAGENNACYIASIFGQTSANGMAVLINSNGKLGTTTSSKRFKEDIESMEEASHALFALKPVKFRYKKEIDPAGTSQFGLVAEEVEKVNPDLIVRDKQGKAYSVRYDQVNAMLLNEFLKEHRAFVQEQRKVEQQQKDIDVLKAELKEQRSFIQKVSDRVGLGQPAPRVALNIP
jgi:hypothetical protein